MNEHGCKLWIAFVLLIFLVGCAPAPATPAAPDYWPTNGWQSAAPEEQGMDSEKLAQMVEHIQQGTPDLRSLLIIRNGYLLSELYNYPYSATQAEWVASTTKSVIGALIGIAIQQGYIKDVNQPLFSLLPEEGVANLDDQKKAITLENLLTQTSGLDCHENPAPGEPSVETSENWVKFMLDQPMIAKPGTRFNYCTGAVHLLSAILQKATGMSTRQFANQNLFAPLGIAPATETRWPSDPQGVTTGGYGLALTPLEMAKLGYLFLNQGQWDGKTILPADWVAASTTSHSNLGDKKEYGYLWWIDPQGKWYAALGRGGQHVFVYPAENLVVVFTAGLPFTNDADLIPLQELLDQYILPAVKSDRPLPANPQGLEKLQAGVQALAQGQSTIPEPLPAFAGELSGKTFTLEDNPFGWQTLVFSFQDGASEGQVNINGTIQAVVGLDNQYRFNTGPDGTFPQGLRSHWENQDTMVVDSIVLGQLSQSFTRIRFAGDTIHVTWEDKYSDTKVEIQGSLSP